MVPACEMGHTIGPSRPADFLDRCGRQSGPTAPNTTCVVGMAARSPGDRCAVEECRADIMDVKSPIKGLRFHDLRHHAIAELAESQTTDSTIMAIAGHVLPKMLAHYLHVRLKAKRGRIRRPFHDTASAG